jgi:hypothetical protein
LRLHQPTFRSHDFEGSFMKIKMPIADARS